MAKLQDGTRVYGSLVVDGALLLGVNSGFSNLVVLTTGTSYTLPAALQYAGAKFKLTIIGRGGAGGSTEAATARVGSSGGSGGVSTTPPWLWPVVITGGLLLVGGGALILSRK